MVKPQRKRNQDLFQVLDTAARMGSWLQSLGSPVSMVRTGTLSDRGAPHRHGAFVHMTRLDPDALSQGWQGRLPHLQPKESCARTEIRQNNPLVMATVIRQGLAGATTAAEVLGLASFT
jgi:hypothetical protein